MQKIHFGMTGAIFITGIIAPWIELKVYGREVRPFILASLVVYGLVPFGHWLYITPAVFRNEVTTEFVLTFLWYGLGFLLFLCKMPEKLFPKR